MDTTAECESAPSSVPEEVVSTANDLMTGGGSALVKVRPFLLNFFLNVNFLFREVSLQA